MLGWRRGWLIILGWLKQVLKLRLIRMELSLLEWKRLLGLVLLLHVKLRLRLHWCGG